MTDVRKPWWKRKRWIAAAAALWLSLPILYPLSAGPLFYAWYRDWISVDTVAAIYGPLAEVQKRSPQFDAALNCYLDWWHTLSVQHRPEEFTTPDPDSLTDPAPATVTP